jgi:hypothetical protein
MSGEGRDGMVNLWLTAALFLGFRGIGEMRQRSTAVSVFADSLYDMIIEVIRNH